MAWREGSPKIKEFEKCLINQFLSLLKKPPGKIKQSFQVSKKVAHTTSNWLPPHPPQTPATSLTPKTRFLHEVNELTRQTTPPPPATYTKVRNFGNFLRPLGKTTTKKIGFYFFTYEWSRRRLPLIKMINGVEEVLILLFTAFGYEYLF